MMAAAYQGTGAFLYEMADDAFLSVEDSGANLTGTLTIAADGEISYLGDFLGNNESGHTWWSPIGTVIGTWHCRLSFVSGSNVYASGESLATWVALTSDRLYNFSKVGATGPDTATGTYSLDFSDDAGSTTHATKNITVGMENATP